MPQKSLSISDNDISWMRKRVWITPYDMQAIVEATDTLGGSIDAGVIPTVVTTSGLVGWVMTDGQFLCGGIPLPNDIDPGHPLGFQIHWTADANGDCTADWILQYKFIMEGVVFARPTASLVPAIGLADSHGSTDWSHAITSKGYAVTHGLTRSGIQDGGFMLLEVEMDAAENETAIIFLGIMFDYSVQQCSGPGSVVDQPTNA